MCLSDSEQKLDHATLCARVALAYDQMLVGFAAYPDVSSSQSTEDAFLDVSRTLDLVFSSLSNALPPQSIQIWLEYARWHSDGGGAGPAAAVAVLQRATRALPGCVLLYFAMADTEEVIGRIEEAKQVFYPGRPQNEAFHIPA